MTNNNLNDTKQDESNNHKLLQVKETHSISSTAKHHAILPDSSSCAGATDSQDDDEFFYNVHPVHLLLFASLPLCLGAFAGYKIEMKRFLATSSYSSSLSTNPASTETAAATTTAESSTATAAKVSSVSSMTPDHYSPGTIGSAVGSENFLNRLFLGNRYKEEVQKSMTSQHMRSSSPSTKIAETGTVVPNASPSHAHGRIKMIHYNGTTPPGVGVAKGTSTIIPTTGTTIDASRIAFKALGIGSMLSIGGVGLLTAGVFHWSGCQTLQELIDTWREWTPRKRIELETKFGIQPKSMQHEDVVATKGMTEEEEWEYIKRKYIPELATTSKGEKKE